MLRFRHDGLSRFKPLGVLARGVALGAGLVGCRGDVPPEPADEAPEPDADRLQRHVVVPGPAPETGSSVSVPDHGIPDNTGAQELSCSLDEHAMKQRMLRVQALFSRVEGQAKPIDGGYELRLPLSVAGEALELTLLERRCCGGVSAEISIPAEGVRLTFTIRGPQSFVAELAGLLPDRGT